jgi:hypothetical protein
MIDQKSIDKELQLIFAGDYGADHDWHYTLSSTEIVKGFITIFNKWEKLEEVTKEKLLKIAVETIINEFSIESDTIKFSLSNIQFDSIRNAVLERLNSTYLAKYYVREIALNKSLYPTLIEHVKTNLEKGVYKDDSIEIAALLVIELKPGQR